MLGKPLDKEAEMARTANRTSILSSRSKRADLPKRDKNGKIRNKPYFVELVPGKLSLGWRATSSAWLARFYLGGRKYQDEAIKAKADDILDSNGKDILNYAEAQERLRDRYTERQKEAAAPPARDTVGDALDRYEVDLKTRGGDTGNVTRVRRRLSEPLVQRPAAEAEAKEFRAWRDDLAQKLPPGTVNRTAVGLMAALNHAADLDPRIAANRQAWKIGLKAFEDVDKSNNVILPEPVIRAIIEKAGTEDGEFQLLIEVLAVSGARYNQAARLQVQDLQDRGATPRLMMPVSRKGRGQKQITQRPVPIPPILAAKLRAVVKGRPMTDRLLLRKNGEPWGKSNHSRMFARVVQKAGLDPNTTVYALRHSNIVRQLLAGVPGRVVAVNHDTSLAMIERTYSAHIGDHADALTRAALLDVTEDSDLGIVRR
jgi:integrase